MPGCSRVCAVGCYWRGPAATYSSCRDCWVGLGRSTDVRVGVRSAIKLAWKACSAGSCGCLSWHRAWKWHSPAPLSLEKCPKEPCLCRTYSNISKSISLLDTPGIFQTATSMFYLHGAVSCTVCLRIESVFYYPGSPRAEPSDF